MLFPDVEDDVKDDKGLKKITGNHYEGILNLF